MLPRFHDLCPPSRGITDRYVDVDGTPPRIKMNLVALVGSSPIGARADGYSTGL
jgi:hypothetical protein